MTGNELKPQTAAKVKWIQSRHYDDYIIVSKCVECRNRYEAAVIDGIGGNQFGLYIAKEAYRRIANMRGYDDTAIERE